MGDPNSRNTRLVVTGIPSARVGASTAGIGWPRLYDLLIQVLTRGRDRAYRERVLELAGIAPGDHVLDIGCGTGTQAIAAWQRSQPGGAVVGVDVSTTMLAAARRKARRATVDVAFHEADAAALPFEDHGFTSIEGGALGWLSLHFLRGTEL